MEAVANNIANVSTTGFKATISRSRPIPAMRATTAKCPTSDSCAKRALVRDMSTGPIASTGNPLDVAIDGDGAFSRCRDRTAKRSTQRAGKLQPSPPMDNCKRLPASPCSANQARRWCSTHAMVRRSSTKTGSISINGVEAGKIGVFKFESPEGLQKVGDNAYAAADQTPPPRFPTRALSRAPLRAPTCARWWSLPE